MPAPFHTGLHDDPRRFTARLLVVAALCAGMCVPALPFAAQAAGTTRSGVSHAATGIDPNERAWVLRKVASLVVNDPASRTASNLCR